MLSSVKFYFLVLHVSVRIKNQSFGSLVKGTFGLKKWGFCFVVTREKGILSCHGGIRRKGSVSVRDFLSFYPFIMKMFPSFHGLCF